MIACVIQNSEWYVRLICVNIDNCLTFSMSNTRSNVCKLVKYYSIKNGCQKIFFALRVFDNWNSLSDDIICCTNVKQLTSRLKATDLFYFHDSLNVTGKKTGNKAI